MVFHGSLSDSKSPQVSRTLLSIIADLNNAYFQVFQSRYQSFGDCIERTSYNWYHRQLHVTKFFQLSCKFQIFIYLFAFLQFYPVVNQNGKVHYSTDPFFCCWLSLGLIVRDLRSVCISKSQRILCISCSRTDFSLCIYNLFVWSNLNFLNNSQWITLPTLSCQDLYSFCVYLLHSLIM